MQRLIASNTHNHLRVGGLIMQASKSGGYSIALDYYLPSFNTTAVILPGIKVMQRLAKELLNCEYREWYKRKESVFSNILFFSIDTGLSLERRAAFLAAVATHTMVEK